MLRDICLPLNRERHAHATADAKRGEALLRAAFAISCSSVTSTRAGGADRMADGDGTAVDVHDLRIPAHILVHCERLRREGLVGLNKIKLARLPARLFQRLPRGRDRA